MTSYDALGFDYDNVQIKWEHNLIMDFVEGIYHE